MVRGDKLQFERKGFYMCRGEAPEGGLEFSVIPESVDSGERLDGTLMTGVGPQGGAARLRRGAFEGFGGEVVS